MSNPRRSVSFSLHGYNLYNNRSELDTVPLPVAFKTDPAYAKDGPSCIACTDPGPDIHLWLGQAQAAANGNSLPAETVEFAHRMFDAARNGDTTLLAQAIEAGLPANLTNEKG